MMLNKFKDLPALISREKVKEVSGWSDADLKALVAAGSLQVWHRPEFKRKDRPERKGSEKTGHLRGPYGRYYTVEVARLCGCDLSKG